MFDNYTDEHNERFLFILNIRLKTRNAKHTPSHIIYTRSVQSYLPFRHFCLLIVTRHFGPLHFGGGRLSGGIIRVVGAAVRGRRGRRHLFSLLARFRGAGITSQVQLGGRGSHPVDRAVTPTS